jgi:hypothetical protein
MDAKWSFNTRRRVHSIPGRRRKHETEDLQMDIHPGLGVLATGNQN